MAETTHARLRWHRGMSFVAQSGSGHGLVLDSVGKPGHLGPSPMELFLIGVGGCTAIDVVSILRKMREDVEDVEVEVVGQRAESHPKYFTAITMIYRVKGRGLSREKVERAVELSHSTYCSASASLRPDCRVTARIELEESQDASR
jgi:putative redox protein